MGTGQGGGTQGRQACLRLLLYEVVVWDNPELGASDSPVEASTLPQPLRQKRQAGTFFFFLGSHLWPMEVPRLGVKSELQLPVYTTAIAMQH